MGIFDRLWSALVGGDESMIGGDPSMQSHGSHWDTVLDYGEGGVPVQDAIMSAVSDGAARGGAGEDIVGYVSDGEDVWTTVVTESGGVLTGYPTVGGVSHEFVVEEVREWQNGEEAWVGGTLGPATVTAFATDYYEHSRAELDGNCSASLSLLAYDLSRVEEDTVVGPDGEELDLSGFAGLVPFERGGPDDYVVRTVVEAVRRVEEGNASGYLLRVPLFRDETDGAYEVDLFVADHVVGEYEPTVGDSVEGPCWLQASFEN